MLSSRPATRTERRSHPGTAHSGAGGSPPPERVSSVWSRIRWVPPPEKGDPPDGLPHREGRVEPVGVGSGGSNLGSILRREPLCDKGSEHFPQVRFDRFVVSTRASFLGPARPPRRQGSTTEKAGLDHRECRARPPRMQDSTTETGRSPRVAGPNGTGHGWLCLRPRRVTVVAASVSSGREDGGPRSTTEPIPKGQRPSRPARLKPSRLIGGFAHRTLLRNGDGYKSIDPIPRLGDPCADVGAFASDQPADAIHDTAATLARQLGLDPDRAIAWSTVWTVMVAAQAWRPDQDELDDLVARLVASME